MRSGSCLFIKLQPRAVRRRLWNVWVRIFCVMDWRCSMGIVQTTFFFKEWSKIFEQKLCFLFVQSKTKSTYKSSMTVLGEQHLIQSCL